MPTAVVQRINQALGFAAPKRQSATPAPPEFTDRAAAECLAAAARVEAEEQQLSADTEAAAANLQAAQEAYQREAARIDERSRSIRQERERATRARAHLLRGSEPSAAELELHDRGRQLNLDVGKLRLRTNCHAAEMTAPEATEDAKTLARLNSEIADLKAAVARLNESGPGRMPGASGEEFALRDLQTKRDHLAPAVAKYEQRYAHFLEIQRLKGEMNAAYAERERLRKEREDGVIAAAVAAVRSSSKKGK